VIRGRLRPVGAAHASTGADAAEPHSTPPPSAEAPPGTPPPAGGAPRAASTPLENWKQKLIAKLDGAEDAPGFEATLRPLVETALKFKGLKDDERHKLVEALAVHALRRRGKLLRSTREPRFATTLYWDSVLKRLRLLGSDGFKGWFFQWAGQSTIGEPFRRALAAAQATALNEGEPYELTPYWCRRGDAIYMSNGESKLVKISPGGVEVLDNGTDGVYFCANLTLAPWSLLAEPEGRNPMSACRLFSEAHWADERARDIFGSWLLGLPAPGNSKPILCATGIKRSGKTTAVQGAAWLYGIPDQVRKVAEADERSVWAEMDRGGLLILDNVDSEYEWLQDTLAVASTGGTHASRALYTDSDIVEHVPRAWVAITSVRPTFAGDPAVADRLLVVRFDGTYAGGASVGDEQLRRDVEQNRDACLTFIAWTLARATATETRRDVSMLNSRHPGWADLAFRVAKALGRAEEICRALLAGETDKDKFALENDRVGRALMEMLHEGEVFEDDAAELLKKLSTFDDVEFQTDGFGRFRWTPRKLSKVLHQLWPSLEVYFKAKKWLNREKVTVFHLEAPRSNPAKESPAQGGPNKH
jgi:hypothetical protein